MLAGYLQNGEAVVMEHAALRWISQLKEEGIWFRLVNWVHDEYQTEVRGDRSVAEKVGHTQAEAIKWAGEFLSCNCPLSGSYSIGSNWHETH